MYLVGLECSPMHVALIWNGDDELSLDSHLAEWRQCWQPLVISADWKKILKTPFVHLTSNCTYYLQSSVKVMWNELKYWIGCWKHASRLSFKYLSGPCPVNFFDDNFSIYMNINLNCSMRNWIFPRMDVLCIFYSFYSNLSGGQQPNNSFDTST